MTWVALQIIERTDFSIKGPGSVEYIWQTMNLDHYLTHKLSSRKIKVLTVKGKTIILSEGRKGFFF